MRLKLPEYDNIDIQEIIRRKIHSEDDRKILCYRLIKGWTIQRIADEIKMPYSTVRDHYYEQVKILFDERYPA